MQRPVSSEYIPAAKNYVDLVPEGDFLELLRGNKSEVISFFNSIPAEKHEFRYAAGKWTIKEILLHLTDAERVFAYRALTLGRGDVQAILPNMNENTFAANANVSGRTLTDILQEFSSVRDASLYLFNNFSAEQLRMSGKLFDHPVTPLGFGYVIIGHSLHHINIAKDRYLS